MLGRLFAALAVPLALGGCGALGLGSAPPSPSPSPPPGAAPWLVVATGSVTPSPGASYGWSPGPALPSVSFLSAAPGCPGQAGVDPVLIPLTVTPGRGSLTVAWPHLYGPDYRIAAVPQLLVAGGQPAPSWRTVPGGTGCTVTTTISGLSSGKPYVVWLDAPHSGYLRDGARHTYSGRSGVVYPL
jgi:hypothetical protein